MIIAPATSDETERLLALSEYNVLDTDSEKVFDDLTALASEICKTPIALISLVDEDRQWFKAKVGLDAAETSRDIAFCAHAIHQKHVFEVSDTLKDSRFFDNPLVTADPCIRFYAGAPLLTPEGHAIGTLCTIDNTPKTLSDSQRSALEILARSVISNLELRRKVKQLEVANMHKTEFLAGMSHELRTPLNAIIGFSQVMLDEVKHQALPDKFVRYLHHLDNSGRRLLSIVNSVLDLSKIEEGKMHLHLSNVPFRKLWQQLEGMFYATAQSKKLQLAFHVDVPEYVYIDEAKISQIAVNLINNALKFTPSGKAIQVNVNVQDEQLTLAVKDQGIGISPEDQKRLFQKFQQIEHNQTQEGTGLGLAITKGLINLMGGEIKLSSSKGTGSLFQVKIPLTPAPNTASTEITNSTLHIERAPKILVVEDNEINQEVIRAIFDSMALEIDLAASGEEALTLADKTGYDIIFMDIHLPGIDGLETTKHIKQNSPHIPIIGLSADTFELEQFLNPPSEGHALDDYLTKPVDKNKLIQLLNQHTKAAN